MDNGSQSEMTLKRLSSGGYLVMAGRGRDDHGFNHDPFVFAATTIDEALGFLRDKVKPVEPARSSVS